MWKNIGNAVTSTLQHVKKLQSELENQLDEAVGNNDRRDILLESDVGKKDTHSESNIDSKNIQIISVSEPLTEQIEEPPELSPPDLSIGVDKSASFSDNVNVHENFDVSSNQINDAEIHSGAVEAVPLREDVTSSPIPQSSKHLTYDDELQSSKEDKLSDIKTETNGFHTITESTNSMELTDNDVPSIEESSNNATIVDSKITEISVDTSSKTEIPEVSNVSNASNKISNDNDEVQRLRETLTERERSLEAILTRMHEMNINLEESEKTVNQLKSELEKANRVDHSQLSNGELKIKKLNEIIAEKDEKLQSFEREGSLLSKKQSEMEKLLKQQKKETKDKSTEITKLKESKEQLVKAIEEMQDVIRKHESDLNNAAKSISAMTAVNQNANDKFAKFESEILMKSEELSSQRKSLESAWSENNELKRALVEIKNERDDFKRQLGEGASRFVENESSRRDVEQREAILKATSKQLQDSLQRQMSEFTIREERLREELNEMRKRWQEAISSRENLATELSSSTAPLLRQISQLQEALQTKTTVWQGVESSLSESAFKAEKSAAENAKKSIELEEKNANLQEQLRQSNLKKTQYQETIAGLETQIKSLEEQNITLNDQIRDLQSQLYFEIGQKQSFQTSLHELEIRKNIELQELKDLLDETVQKNDRKLTQLESEKDNFLQELQMERNKLGGGISKMQVVAYDASSNVVESSSKPNNSSFVHSERSFLDKIRKDEQSRSSYSKMHQIEASRDALLEEVSYLSSKIAELDDKLQGFNLLEEELRSVKKRNDTLLILLGEKDEELQASFADNMEVKNLYRGHIEELLLQLAPPPPPEATTSPPVITSSS